MAPAIGAIFIRLGRAPTTLRILTISLLLSVPLASLGTICVGAEMRAARWRGVALTPTLTTENGSGLCHHGDYRGSHGRPLCGLTAIALVAVAADVAARVRRYVKCGSTATLEQQYTVDPGAARRSVGVLRWDG